MAAAAIAAEACDRSRELSWAASHSETERKVQGKEDSAVAEGRLRAEGQSALNYSC